MLDYKIKELKRQIEPRENEIADMRKQVEEMDLELEQYHKSNSALDLMIGDLRLKMDGMQKEITHQQGVLSNAHEYVSRFRRDLQTSSRHLDDYKQLKVRREGSPRAPEGGAQPHLGRTPGSPLPTPRAPKTVSPFRDPAGRELERRQGGRVQHLGRGHRGGALRGRIQSC